MKPPPVAALAVSGPESALSQKPTGQPRGTGDDRAAFGVAGATVVWRFMDGKPGHEKQSAGLLQALAEFTPLAVYEFDMRFKALLWRQLHRNLRHRPVDIPSPNLVVGAGHRTHVPMIVTSAVCGGRSVVLMKPTLPHRFFDLIFVPRHDRYRRKGNVVETRGVICPSDSTAKDPGRGLILLGGTSRHFEWSSDYVLGQVAAIARASPEVDWEVCDSRRTPTDLGRALPRLPNLAYRPWQSTPGDFLERALRAAYSVWVTADSASMLYEALSVRAYVGVIALKQKPVARDNKHARGIELLLSQGHVFSTRDGFRLQGRLLPPHFFPENRRCAKIVHDRFVTAS